MADDLSLASCKAVEGMKRKGESRFFGNDDDSCDSDLSDYEMSCDLLTAGRELSSFGFFKNYTCQQAFNKLCSYCLSQVVNKFGTSC